MRDGSPVRMNLSERMAERYGVPADIEEWRFELVMALRNPPAYSAALRAVDNLGLYSSFARLDWVQYGAELCIEHFVPDELAEDFFAGLSDLRAIALAEAAARGLAFPLHHNSQALN